MAKEKKVKPTFQSPYKEVEVAFTDDELGCEITYPVEVLNDEEIQHQKLIRWECVKRTHGLYSPRTLTSNAKKHEKLFECTTAEEVIDKIKKDAASSMTETFRYRSYARILESKLDLFDNEDALKLAKFAIKSLDEYGCIHPQIKDLLKLVCPDKAEN